MGQSLFSQFQKRNYGMSRLDGKNQERDGNSLDLAARFEVLNETYPKSKEKEVVSDS